MNPYKGSAKTKYQSDIFYFVPYNAVIAIGVVMLAIGVILLILEALIGDRGSDTEKEQQHKHVEAGGVVFIGPVPIIFGSDRRIAKWMILAALALGAIMIALLLLSYA